MFKKYIDNNHTPHNNNPDIWQIISEITDFQNLFQFEFFIYYDYLKYLYANNIPIKNEGNLQLGLIKYMFIN